MIKNLCCLLLRLDLLGHRIDNLIVHVTSEYQILCKANEDIENSDKGRALAQDDNLFLTLWNFIQFQIFFLLIFCLMCVVPFANQVANEHHENKSKNGNAGK